jgi:hypothetical protein
MCPTLYENAASSLDRKRAGIETVRPSGVENTRLRISSSLLERSAVATGCAARGGGVVRGAPKRLYEAAGASTRDAFTAGCP